MSPSAPGSAPRAIGTVDAIYARQSIDKKDSLSIEGQIDLCRRYAGAEVRIFQDKGYSGKNTKRPAFTALIHAVEDGEIQKILVYRLDRFSRSIADFSRLWELLERHNVAFQSVTEHFDTASPMGRAMLNILMTFAQLERETTAERVRDSYLHRFSLGAWPGGPAPYGFDLTKITDGTGRRVSALKANDKASVVQCIFENYAIPETSLRSLAHVLMSKAIPGPRRTAWDNVTLSRILHSPLYVQADENVYWYFLEKGLEIRAEPTSFDGLHACNIIGRRDRGKSQGSQPGAQLLTVTNHQGFVPSGLWLAVQRKLEGNRQFPRAGAGKHSWLTGLLKCARCGYAVRINYSREENRFYLLCSGRSNLHCCDAEIRIDLRELEMAAAQELKTLLTTCPETEFPEISRENAAQALELEQQIQRLVQAMAESSVVSAAYISQRIEQLHRARNMLLSEPPQRRSAALRLDFDCLNYEEKKLVAATFIERISLSGDAVNIHWKI